MTHISRHDIWYNLMLFAVWTIHWYNPLVRMLVRRAMNHLEVSCDGDAVAERDSQYRKDYGAMLLREATGDLRFQNALTTCFFRWEKGTEESMGSKNDDDPEGHVEQARNNKLWPGKSYPWPF